MTSLLSSHLEDCSTPQYFCFSVRCEVCGGGLLYAPVFLFFRSLRGMRRILVQQQHPLFQSGTGGPAP